MQWCWTSLKSSVPPSSTPKPFRATLQVKDQRASTPHKPHSIPQSCRHCHPCPRPKHNRPSTAKPLRPPKPRNSSVLLRTAHSAHKAESVARHLSVVLDILLRPEKPFHRHQRCPSSLESRRRLATRIWMICLHSSDARRVLLTMRLIPIVSG